MKKQLPIRKYETQAPTKEELVQDLSEVEETYGNYLETLSEAKLRRIRRSVASRRHGLQTVAPITCMGPKTCMFIEHCPIPDRTRTGDFVRNKRGKIEYGPDSDYPLARPCVMESMYMQQKIIDYVQYLDVDPSNRIEMAIVNELALIDLFKNRALIILSKGDKKGHGQDFMRVDVTNFDAETGMVAEHTALHPAADMIDKLEKRRERWLRELSETRRSKIEVASKLKNNMEDSKVLDELNKLREALENTTVDAEEIVEVKFDRL